MINDVLDLSKIESGMINLKPILFDVEDFFLEFYSSSLSKIVNSNVKLCLDTPGEHLIINIDQGRVLQIMNNFTSNAIKYTFAGEITIGYRIENDGIMLFVKDTGVGIPESKHKLVFSRFEKLDRFEQGTGLGLAICKAITDAKNGKIWFESQENVGSKFYAWMPFAK